MWLKLIDEKYGSGCLSAPENGPLICLTDVSPPLPTLRLPPPTSPPSIASVYVQMSRCFVEIEHGVSLLWQCNVTRPFGA